MSMGKHERNQSTRAMKVFPQLPAPNHVPVGLLIKRQSKESEEVGGEAKKQSFDEAILTPPCLE